MKFLKSLIFIPVQADCNITDDTNKKHVSSSLIYRIIGLPVQE